MQLVLATKVLKCLIRITNSSLLFTLSVNELYFHKEQNLIKSSCTLQDICEPMSFICRQETMTQDGNL